MEMTRYAYGQSKQSEFANLHLENRDLRAALAAALNDRNVWRDLFYTAQPNAAPIEAIEHGTPKGYRQGCRCQPCATAQSKKNQAAYQRRKQNQS